MHRACPKYDVLDDWTLGWDNISSQIKIDRKALLECRNFNLTTYKGLEKRNGMAKLYPSKYDATDTVLKSLHEYKAPNGNTYILASGGTTLKSYYTSAWNTLKSGLTSGKRFSFVNHTGFALCANGTDDNFKLYNTTAYKLGITPPASAPTLATGALTGLTGKYKYVYCYVRSSAIAGRQLVGNPSPVSTEKEVTNQSIQVSYTASTDPQVDKIWIYRTLDLFGANTDSTQYFKVVEVANATSNYDDNNDDNDLTTLCETDNDAPPKAKFMCLHKDYVFYANCPDKTDGEHLVMWSKQGVAESVPSANHHFFDRADGEPITGVASLGDYLLMFKRNKIGVIEGNFDQFYTLSYGVGCIAGYAIIQLEDKVIFLAEEGWKAFDGVNLYNISEKIEGLVVSGYTTAKHGENFSGVYYPERLSFQFLLDVTGKDTILPIGHFIVPLIYVDKGIPEQEHANVVSWTYHQYDYHNLKVLGNYTDSEGITRVIAGDDVGYVYLLDTGDSDDGNNIYCKMSTGWLTFGTTRSLTKTPRLAYLDYVTGTTGEIKFQLDVDFSPDVDHTILMGTESAYCGFCYCGYAYCGIDGSLNEPIRLKGTGRLFRYTIETDNQQALKILSITTHFRKEGLRA